MVRGAASECDCLELSLPMQSIIQVKKTQASDVSPAFAISRNRRPCRLSSEQETMIAGAVASFLRSESRPKIQAYHEYRWRCNQVSVRPVSARTFYWRLRGLPVHPVRPQLSHFLSVVLIDETTLDLTLNGGAS